MSTRLGARDGRDRDRHTRWSVVRADAVQVDDVAASRPRVPCRHRAADGNSAAGRCLVRIRLADTDNEKVTKHLRFENAQKARPRSTPLTPRVVPPTNRRA